MCWREQSCRAVQQADAGLALCQQAAPHRLAAGDAGADALGQQFLRRLAPVLRLELLSHAALPLRHRGQQGKGLLLTVQAQGRLLPYAGADAVAAAGVAGESQLRHDPQVQLSAGDGSGLRQQQAARHADGCRSR